MKNVIFGAIVLVALLLWISTAYQSCNTSDTPAEVEDTGNDEFDDLTFSENEDEVSDEDLDATQIDDLEEEDPSVDPPEGDRPAAAIGDDRNATPAASSNTERYMVVAGTFQNQTYAESHLEKVKKLGFNNAELVKFDFSNYHTICVDRYDELTAANNTVSTLKNSGIDAYVHRRRGKGN